MNGDDIGSADSVESTKSGGSPAVLQSEIDLNYRRWLRSVGGWVCTHNPFYAISAALVFAGLRLSFGPEGQSPHLWGLAAGVAGYALLLSVTSVLLVRLGKVWDDVRSMLLIIVLMLVAMSSSVDEILVQDFNLGAALLAAGLALAMVLSESVLRGLRLRLSASFRLPYYVMLTLFFVYPIIVVYPQFAAGGHALHWTLFGFSGATALAVLTLLPAAHRGRTLVTNNGSPWNWPWYPWTMFGGLGLFAISRTYSLCISFDALGGSANVFGPFFLTLPCIAVAAVVVEAGMTSWNRRVTNLGLALAALGPALALVGRTDVAYDAFVADFVASLGCTPLFASLCIVAMFYLIATIRQVPGAGDCLSLTLAIACFVAPTSQQLDSPTFLTPSLLIAIAVLQLIVAIRRGRSSRALLGAACAVVGTTLVFDDRSEFVITVTTQAMLLSAVLVTVVFNDPTARWLRRQLGWMLILVNAAWLMNFELSPLRVPSWIDFLCPVAWVAIAYVYAWFMKWRPFLRAGTVVAIMWVCVHGAHGYRELRMLVAGLDLLAGGAVFFLAALFISLCKASEVVRQTASRLLRDEPAS